MKIMVSVLVLCFAACSGDGKGGGGTQVDAAVAKPDSGLETQCGHPGDPGNEMGVGKYCDQLGDCSGQAAALCATLGDPNAHFCTKTCTMGSSTCGTNATCACQGGQCGCLPNTCL